MRRHPAFLRTALVTFSVAALSLTLGTTSLQYEFFSVMHVAAPPKADPVPVGIAAQINLLARDIARRFHIERSDALDITKAAYSAAKENGIDPTLVLAVAAVESKFQPDAVNASTGAVGLMQVLPKWHQDKIEDVGGESALLTIAPNIQVGAAILAEYVDAEDGNVFGALGHYLGVAGAAHYIDHVVNEMAHFGEVRSRPVKRAG